MDVNVYKAQLMKTTGGSRAIVLWWSLQAFRTFPQNIIGLQYSWFTPCSFEPIFDFTSYVYERLTVTSASNQFSQIIKLKKCTAWIAPKTPHSKTDNSCLNYETHSKNMAINMVYLVYIYPSNESLKKSALTASVNWQLKGKGIRELKS